MHLLYTIKLWHRKHWCNSYLNRWYQVLSLSLVPRSLCSQVWLKTLLNLVWMATMEPSLHSKWFCSNYSHFVAMVTFKEILPISGWGFKSQSLPDVTVNFKSASLLQHSIRNVLAVLGGTPCPSFGGICM